ncbi:hypothetical protein CDAIGKPJ_00963 [Aeromonas salmonicida]
MMQGETKQHRKQQYLENIAAGKGADHAARDHVQQEGDDALRLGLLGIGRDGAGIQRGRVHVHAHPGLQQVDHAQPYDQGDGAHHLKVEQRYGAGFPHRLHALHAGDTRHHGTENNRGYDHLD